MLVSEDPDDVGALAQDFLLVFGKFKIPKLATSHYGLKMNRAEGSSDLQLWWAALHRYHEATDLQGFHGELR